jgi:exonuclease III
MELRRGAAIVDPRHLPRLAADLACDDGATARCGKDSEPWNGVAILARGATPVLTRRTLPGDPADDQARYIDGRLDLPA